jgi:serine/threonine protein phosphatase 1
VEVGLVLKLIGRRWGHSRPEPFSASMDPGGLVYAVGDIHGRYDLVVSLVDRIFEDAAGFGETPRLVFLGDYIDRGEQSRETLEFLTDLAERGEAETVFLMGNHEQMLMRFLREPKAGWRWLRYGGLQTLLSYGVSHVGNPGTEGEVARLQSALLDAMEPHMPFFSRLQLSHRAGNVFFAHAGADPALPTDQQEIATLLWGCERFRTADRRDGIWVVHGHFVVDRPVAERGRISIDTGAYFSGRLTAARIAGGEAVFLEG